jgi:hypothetical protein
MVKKGCKKPIKRGKWIERENRSKREIAGNKA